MTRQWNDGPRGEESVWLSVVVMCALVGGALLMIWVNRG